jgi:N-acyl-L-homoserine lactone synthetase
MRVVALTKYNAHLHTDLIDQMHDLRARVFFNRLGWKVRIVNGKELDEFDFLQPTYILVVTDNEKVVGSARLLPATGPTMLGDTFPQLLTNGRLDGHPQMIESSRFCVDTTAVAARPERSLHIATLTLFAGIIQWSIDNSYNEIVTATDVRFERILQRVSWPMRRLGNPCLIGNTMSVAGILQANYESFTRVRPNGYDETCWASGLA